MRAVVTLGNDRYLEWTLAMLASLRVSNPEMPVLIIPFDDRCDTLRELCPKFGARMWEPSALLEQCDEMARLVLPEEANRRFGGTFRRFSAFAGPFDEFVYLDGDTITLEPLDPVFDACSALGRGIVFGDFGQAFHPGPRRDELLAIGHEWNSGVLFAGNRLTTPALMLEAARDHLGSDRDVLIDSMGDQPFLNWYLLHDRIPARPIYDTGRYNGAWSLNPAVEVAGHLYAPGTPPYRYRLPFVHWPGFPEPTAWMPYAHLWNAYRAMAARIVHCG